MVSLYTLIINQMNLKNYIKEKILSVKNYDRPTIIGIDGPTAAGKTYLAEDLKILLKKILTLFGFAN